MKEIKLKVVDASGTDVGYVEFDEKFIDIKPDEGLVHFVQNAVLKAQAPMRAGHYKTVGAVNRTHKKPFRQKRQGRARQGSRKAIHMIGGGVAFGFNQDADNAQAKRRSIPKVNKQVKKLAFSHVIKNKLDNAKLQFVDWKALPSKTSEAFTIVKPLFEGNRSILFVQNLAKNNTLALRGLKGIMLKNINELNIVDMLKGTMLVVDVSALERLRLCSGFALEYTKLAN